jgi:phosphoadenosine phosphosulfate reductase
MNTEPDSINVVEDSVEQTFTFNKLAELNQKFSKAYPDEVLKWGFKTFGNHMVLGTGFGSSGVVLMHRLHELKLPVSVFYLDTQLLFDETYQLRDELENRLNVSITRVAPSLSLEQQSEKYGEALWKRDPNKCCHLRKVRPLRNYLSDKQAWITGVRRHQSASRSKTQVIELDYANNVVKINPLANWSSEEIWGYIDFHELPYNPLHDEGYPSIGCIPCTEPVREGEDERAGRWRGNGKTECGIHLTSHSQNGAANGTDEK